MGRKAPMALAVVLLLCISVAAQGALTSTQSSRLAIGQTTRSQLLQQLNKQVEFEGFFVQGSTPILVQNLALLQQDSPLPPDKYVPLTGPVPSSLRSGAKVRIGGQLKTPTGEGLQGESLSLQLATGAQASILQEPPSAIAGLVHLNFAIPAPPPQPMANRYALLIGTGANGANDWPRYWNDLVRMYQLLIAKGYPAANIRVCHAWGAPKTASMPVHYAATVAGITNAFSYFVPRVHADDRMYIMVVGQSPTSGVGYWTWGGVLMFPGALAFQVNRITAFEREVVHLHFPKSGAFINYLRRPNRMILTAAASNKDSWAHPTLMYGNFDYWFLSGLRGHQLIGEAPVDADTNDNGQVSIGEAYNFTLAKPGGVTPYGEAIPPISAQQPQFEDNNAPPSRWGTLPGAGEGALGVNTYL